MQTRDERAKPLQYPLHRIVIGMVCRFASSHRNLHLLHGHHLVILVAEEHRGEVGRLIVPDEPTAGTCLLTQSIYEENVIMRSPKLR